MAKDPSGVYTMRNHGREGNCSFANIYQTKISIVQMQIGAGSSDAQLKVSVYRGGVNRGRGHLCFKREYYGCKPTVA